MDFEKINKELASRRINPENAFYGADTGVILSERGQGLGKLLLQERSQKIDSRYTLFRTKNLVMLELYRKAMGNEIFSFPEESSYKGGMVYVFRK